MRLLPCLGLLGAAAVGVASEATNSSFWMDSIAHNGVAAFNSDKTYVVYRNVMDYGAKGDGVTDDTEAINLAISTGNRCGGEVSCVGSTTTPAVVFFPHGTYLISSSIIDYYYTQLVGDPRQMPTIKASEDFVANIIGMVDADLYVSGTLKYTSTNVFFRQIRNIRFDTTDVPGTVAAIHWPTAQATSIQNCVFVLSPDQTRQHTGIFMEEGSGGFMNDLVFYGGTYGCQFGSQQYTMRNLTFFNVQTAILQIWNWSWTYKSIYVYDCAIGLNMSGPVIGSVAVLDSGFYNTPTGILAGRAPATQTKPGAGSLVLENVVFRNVSMPLQGPNGTLIPADASDTVVSSYVFGNVYAPTGPKVYQGAGEAYFAAADSLKMGSKYLERSKPQYDHVDASYFLTARSFGATGDGVTDDTAALNALFANASSAFSHAIAFVDAGFYRVTDTVRIPPNVRIVGEALAAVIMGAGAKFESMSAPHAVVQVGQPGEEGYLEWSDMIVSTQGPTAGAVLIEYNLATPRGACAAVNPPSGMWDVHVRVGGFAGSELQVAQCEKTPDEADMVPSECVVSYLSLHITRHAGNLYLENNWFWVADHDIEDATSTQISLFGGRGVLVESQDGPVWMYATASEHHVKYQYQLVNAANIWMGLIQTETPYFQPNPMAPAPFTHVNTTLSDPDFAADCASYSAPANGSAPCAMAWGLRILDSANVSVWGAGLYSFFSNYNTSCSDPGNGENCQARMVYLGTTNGTDTGNMTDIDVYNLNTIGAVRMVERDSTDVVLYAENIAGYTACVAVVEYWQRESENATDGGAMAVAVAVRAPASYDVAGDVKQLCCAQTGTTWPPPERVARAVGTPTDAVLAELTTGGTATAVGTSTTTLLPVLSAQYPAPLPSQTDCSYVYTW